MGWVRIRDANPFFSDFERLLSAEALAGILAEHGPLRRGRAQVSGGDLLAGLVCRVGQKQGTLSAHLHELTGTKISDSAASQRRLTMPWEVFQAVLGQALAPLADPLRQPAAFYAGLRLAGLDGTRFSPANTPRVLGEMTKAASRRFAAAFAKPGVRVLVELGTRAPPARAIPAPGLEESEAAPARELLPRLPVGSLLLGDRPHGCGAFIGRPLCRAPGGKERAFPLRVGKTPKPRLRGRLADGGQPVEVAVGDEEGRALGQGAVRLWTSLLDEKAHPALELLALYARRREQEIAYRELKIDLRAGGNLPPASHTSETAAREIAALLVAMAMVARARLQMAREAGAAPLRVSFGRTLAALRPL